MLQAWNTCLDLLKVAVLVQKGKALAVRSTRMAGFVERNLTQSDQAPIVGMWNCSQLALFHIQSKTGSPEKLS